MQRRHNEQNRGASNPLIKKSGDRSVQSRFSLWHRTQAAFLDPGAQLPFLPESASDDPLMLHEIYSVFKLTKASQASMRISLGVTDPVPTGLDPMTQNIELSALDRDYTIVPISGEVFDDVLISPNVDYDGVMQYLFERAESVKA
jgi:hypothetical protein